jgi:hypothetical protein
MSDVKGLLFANGVQALAIVRKEDDHFLWVENMLALQMKVDDEEGEAAMKERRDPVPKLYFEHFTPFAELAKTGLDTKIPQSAIMFTFLPEARILAGYKNRTSLVAHRDDTAPSIIVRS